MKNQRYDITSQVLVNGRKVREYSHEGDTYVAAKKGTEFEIELKNVTSKRLVAIVSVDGLDVVSGKPATSDSSGYIVEPFSNVKVKGFRKDDDVVGAFKFTGSDDSYAEGTGDGGNEGVIAVRYYGEYQPPLQLLTDALRSRKLCNDNPSREGTGYHTPYTATYSGKITPQSAGMIIGGSIECNLMGESKASYSSDISYSDDTLGFDMGTTWGSKRTDKIEMVEFERGDLVTEHTIFYASDKALKSMGVPMIKKSAISKPKAFTDFAEPPKGWG